MERVTPWRSIYWPRRVYHTATQLEMVRVSCYQLLQVLESPYNVSNAAPLGEHQVLRGPAILIYPQVMEHVTCGVRIY